MAQGKRTAVVVIHGMGEQVPMETLRGFVEAVWSRDPEIVTGEKTETFSKPERLTGSFELRRITTRTSPSLGRRCDFYEFYWAHLMSGNTVSSLVSWLKGLLVRSPGSVPRRLFWQWVVGLTVLILAAVAFAMVAVPDAYRPGPRWPWLLAAGFAALVGLALRSFVPVAGDAARYLTPKPPNIGARQAIREAGVKLIEQLHGRSDYDRIVVVAHSLGTVVGYDVLHHAWARLSENDLAAAHRPGSATAGALERLETAAVALEAASGDTIGPARIDYRDAQRAYGRSLADPAEGARAPWLVSDFVTLGSPLSKTDVLLARVKAQWDSIVGRRDVPVSPPLLETKEGRTGFSYPWAGSRIPHHAAAFAPTVVTNVYFDNPAVVAGDLVAGPVAPMLGRGVLDVKVRSRKFFRHLDYWKDPAAAPPHRWIRALRRALNLAGRDERALWGAQAGREILIAEELPETIG